MHTTTIFTILALAASNLAAPAPAPAPAGDNLLNQVLAPRACTYPTSNEKSTCRMGDTGFFCSGNGNVCPPGANTTFDATANRANERACDGLTLSSACIQMFSCDCQPPPPAVPVR